MVALGATQSADGIISLPNASGAGAFAVASVNLGASAEITVTPQTPGVDLGLNLQICQTNPTSGQCLSPPATNVTLIISEGATPTFSVFVTPNSAIAFDPAANRIRVSFSSGGVTRGATSVAVRTLN